MTHYKPGHDISQRKRTTDVLIEEQIDFHSLLLSPTLLRGLNEAGFEKPSPIQLKAIPLGRCGLDLIAQAKSGTGKTCVFSVIALENVITESNCIQIIILTPTREIAVQVKDVICAIGCHYDGLACKVFIGGISLEEDKKALKSCHIAVGTPGRVKYLIEQKYLKTESVRMFILDEADKLLDESFQQQINWIFSALPENKQMMAFSATYPEVLANHLKKYMTEPTFVRLNAADPSLQGIKQFYSLVRFHPLPHKTFQEKVDGLIKLLSSVNFNQCLVFSNYQIRAKSLSDTLCRKGWPSTFIAGSQTQAKRLEAMEKLKSFHCRILISTDLTARGIDAENVNLVVNMDVPHNGETYLHRIGRAGRFGTEGMAVTYVANGKEERELRDIERSIDVKMELLPAHIPDTLLQCKRTSEGQNNRDTVEISIMKVNSNHSRGFEPPDVLTGKASRLEKSPEVQEATSSEESTLASVDVPNSANRKMSPVLKPLVFNLPLKNRIQGSSIKSSDTILSPPSKEATNLPSEDTYEEYLAMVNEMESVNIKQAMVHGTLLTLQTSDEIGHTTSGTAFTSKEAQAMVSPSEVNTEQYNAVPTTFKGCSPLRRGTSSEKPRVCPDHHESTRTHHTLPSVDEFEKDFEEYLQLASSAENLPVADTALQKNHTGSCLMSSDSESSEHSLSVGTDDVISDTSDGDSLYTSETCKTDLLNTNNNVNWKPQCNGGNDYGLSKASANQPIREYCRIEDGGLLDDTCLQGSKHTHKQDHKTSFGKRQANVLSVSSFCETEQTSNTHFDTYQEKRNTSLQCSGVLEDVIQRDRSPGYGLPPVTPRCGNQYHDGCDGAGFPGFGSQPFSKPGNCGESIDQRTNNNRSHSYGPPNHGKQYQNGYRGYGFQENNHGSRDQLNYRLFIDEQRFNIAANFHGSQPYGTPWLFHPSHYTPFPCPHYQGGPTCECQCMGYTPFPCPHYQGGPACECKSMGYTPFACPHYPGGPACKCQCMGQHQQSFQGQKDGQYPRLAQWNKAWQEAYTGLTGMIKQFAAANTAPTWG
ncbi:probable ATP-dependent RNA helicase DDX20 isoform X2 [Nematostella vectensis]|uniref:probable ATP-dependent RNA helicase DDX20 isoform X2 n=1 Tax=Nematostella vectensis TaxID=45351 RepID=UPI0013903839|nr:probable ATP-dependent RNA helicase DDX20 isoform X2 [Nematostella vectensis]